MSTALCCVLQVSRVNCYIYLAPSYLLYHSTLSHSVNSCNMMNQASAWHPPLRFMTSCKVPEETGGNHICWLITFSSTSSLFSCSVGKAERMPFFSVSTGS